MSKISNVGRQSAQRRALSLVAVCVVLLTTACGSDADDQTSSNTTSDAPAATGDTRDTAVTDSASAPIDSSGEPTSGEPIVVGMLCACSGFAASVFGTTTEVGEAWAESVNASGGINGHPVELIVKDDGADPAKALVAVKELVEEENAVAIIDLTVTQPSWADYVSEKGVPVIANPTSGAAVTNPNFFPTGPGQQTFWGATTVRVAADGHERIGIAYCAEAPACKLTADIIETFAEEVGIGFTGLAVSGTQPSYVAPCLTMKDDGVDAAVLAQTSEIVVRMLQTCVQQGFSPAQYNNAPGYFPEWLTLPELDGLVLGSPLANFLDTSIPGVQEFQDGLAQYSDLEPKEVNFYGFDAWVSGKIFEAAARSANLDSTSTPADVADALYALTDETLGGITVPLNYVEGEPTLFTCQFEIVVQDGELVSENNGEPVCLSPEHAALATELAAQG